MTTEPLKLLVRVERWKFSVWPLEVQSGTYMQTVLFESKLPCLYQNLKIEIKTPEGYNREKYASRILKSPIFKISNI